MRVRPHMQWDRHSLAAPTKLKLIVVTPIYDKIMMILIIIFKKNFFVSLINAAMKPSESQ